MFLIVIVYLHLLGNVNGNECQFLTLCQCSNFPLFALIDTSYLAKPRSVLNQDLFCAYAKEYNRENRTMINTFEQLKYFYYRFRTLTFANYPMIPSKAFRFVHFESQSVKPTHKANNRNVIAFVNIARTESGWYFPSHLNRCFCFFSKGIFEELTLSDSSDQLMISFLASPSLDYATSALSKVNCYELKFLNTNPRIPIDFFHQVISIHHLIIDNPSFSGFLPSKISFTFLVNQISIKDISVRHLQGKHFPIVFDSVRQLTLENYHVNGGLRSFDNYQLAQRFPRLQTLRLFSRSIQHLTSRMFEHFIRLEYLILNGITAIENEAFFNLYHLKELNLGEDLLRIDAYAFIHMNTNRLVFNQSSQFQLNDDKHFCTFAQFSPSTDLKTFVHFSKNLSDCPCTLRYLYRHLDKFSMPLTPNCYSNSSLYILTQEERICYFEQRLLQCDILPDEGITIYGRYYNVSYFYQQQISQQKNRLSFFFHYRIHYLVFIVCILIGLCFILRQRQTRSYRHLTRLVNRPRSEPVEVIYDHTNGMLETTARVTKV